MSKTNNAVIVKELMPPHSGYPVVGKNIAFAKRPYDESKLKVTEDFPLLVKVLYLSIDPYLRGRFDASSYDSYVPPFEQGAPVCGFAVGVVVDSALDQFKKGQNLIGLFNWEEYALVHKSVLQYVYPTPKGANLPLIDYVGVLGMPSQTAYTGLKLVGQPKAGETIFISAASGAVGQMAGQLCKAAGLYVVGSAGTDEKVEFLKNELHFVAAFNYKKEKPLEALKKYCPKGIDIYFENVGGETLDAVLSVANRFSRIIGCGMISQYNAKEPYPLKNIINIVKKSITFRGFIVSDYFHEYQKEYYADIPKLVHEKKLKYRIDVTKGLENAPDVFLGMLHGKNFGKSIVELVSE
ncbi:NADP-dependent leukotriene B4 12-hydroxydehydrogenase [Schizosaccharomyces japonicus yFS275]|uniref:NADP-dependent leukotriene B4 12-hydroxydehydrogenase n=1 Tax=Schizosaccharomyces japonicus (strain yFS275 / FY16936) TaxID=402676 RepID=B6K1P0_SCHJY|nr:NADP-dependent leukotriene B4 12-hydroxydehydrogenase [Schizosaccharomyces japonicus yFS275]EEB07071.1 NADP-dependent leukotriene B4 12-hydroxydehydrogenase [Schizosaccharomyces japonicus yFS275]